SIFDLRDRSQAPSFTMPSASATHCVERLLNAPPAMGKPFSRNENVGTIDTERRAVFSDCLQKHVHTKVAGGLLPLLHLHFDLPSPGDQSVPIALPLAVADADATHLVVTNN